MLLNEGNIIYFGNDRIEKRTFTTVQCFFDFTNEDYWLFEFANGYSLKDVGKYLPSEVITSIKENKVKLVFNNSHEAFHDSVEYIYQYFVLGMGIAPKQIVLLSESASIHNEIRKVSGKYKAKPINCYWIRVFEYDVNKVILNYPDYTEITTLESKPYPKKFLNLNRRWRIHRPMLVGLLASRDLLKHGYVSLLKNVDGQSWDNMWNVLNYHENLSDTKLQKELLDNQTMINGLPNFLVDTINLHKNQADVNSLLDKHYKNTYFSVVTETNFFSEFGEGVFLSEKIFKPILKKHPFISVARPDTLNELRRIGYKTFAPYINESYDSIENDADRLIAIADEINRLCNLSDTELEEYLTGLREITNYNYEVLKNKQGMDYCNRLI